MKKSKDIGRVLVLLFAILFSAVIAGQASAGTLSWTLDTTISGTSPSGSISVLFDDSYGDANTVLLTMDASGLSGTEGVLQWYFNFDPSETSSNLTLTYSSGAVATTTIDQDNLMADGDGNFDFAFRFQDEPNGLGPDSTNSTSVYEISYSSPIDVSNFNFLSTTGGGQGIYFSAAQVNDINGDNVDSGWVGVVPEPISSTLFIVGGATLGFRRFRKQFRK